MKFHHFKKSLQKIILSTIICALLLSPTAHAAVLGDLSGHTQQEFAQGTTYVKNSFISPQDSVGQQVENYFEYTPNSDVLPIIANGTSVYGKRTLSQANNSLNSLGINTAMGINADFFSFKTGVPMSHTIIDGSVLTKDTGYMPAIGFNADGTAFISTLAIDTLLKSRNGNFSVGCINKYRQPWFIYLFDSRYGDKTMSEGWGINVTLGNVSDQFRLNNSVTAVVEGISEGDGSVPIPQGKIILSVSADAPQELKDNLQNLVVGETVTIDTGEATGDERWLSAKYATGCLGGTLVRDGKIAVEDESAAPRTAVGIKENGNIIFYTLDGRQSGYSFGARKETLAQRMLELGCVDAVNLDGGGSTTMGGVYPETTDFKILNSPSEGALRACSNFIFLQKMNSYSGIPYRLNIFPYGDKVLSGSTVQLWCSALDSAYGKATITEPITYSIENDTPASGTEWWEKSGVDENGILTARGEGEVYVSGKSGSATGSTMLNVVKTPTGISVKSEDTGAQITKLNIKRGESINLTAAAFVDGVQITAQDYSFAWEVPTEVGTIDDRGFFTASNIPGATGNIKVSSGGCIYEIATTVTNEELNVNQNNYPTIEGTANEASFTATLTSPRSTIDASMITFKVDGRETAFEFNSATGTLSYEYPTDFYKAPHGISIFTTDAMGYSAMKHFDIGDLKTSKISFGDIKGHWAEGYISYLATNGILKGSPDSSGKMEFLPGKGVTRAE
ncbi:MAG: phosphodiester glycosidase family protein, partial [Oscillospiraceae bacterium]